MSNKVRLTVDLPIADAQTLANNAKFESCTLTEALRRAIMDTHYIHRALNNGAKLIFEHKSGNMTQAVFKR